MTSRKIILDTETTGLSVKNGDRIIEICCLEMIDEKLTDKKFHTYINTDKDISDGAFKVHNISKLTLKDKPYFKDIVKEFLDFLQDSDIIAHNIRFDLEFINHELSELKLPNIEQKRGICTFLLAKKLLTNSKYSLDALCKKFNIDNSKRNKHGALIDCELAYELYLALQKLN
jgi:DNA polymerase III subunit epsilon